MIDKILNLFFVKKSTNHSVTYISKIQREKSTYRIERVYDGKNYQTCLSKYFTCHKGLNLIERGYDYSINQYTR